MGKLKTELGLIYHEKIQILTPRNCQLVKLKLVSKKQAKILGRLAKEVITKHENLRSIPRPLPQLQQTET